MKEQSGVLGIDEAGMGPWAGPLFVAGVVWDDSVTLEGLTDSKAISETMRETLHRQIARHAVNYRVQSVPVERINTEALAAARQWAIMEIVRHLHTDAREVFIDGVGSKQYTLPTSYVVQGDKTIPAISAASILAKVGRDRVMVALDRRFPEYGFAAHKGYGTKQHQEALRVHGATEIHRIWYEPVARLSGLIEEPARVG